MSVRAHVDIEDSPGFPGEPVAAAFLTCTRAHSGGTVPDSHRVPQLTTSPDPTCLTPMLGAVPSRQIHDRCPGVLRPFAADDGAIVRLRLPGGRTDATELVDISALAEEFGAPFVQLTSRGNLQLRGLPEPLPEPFVRTVERLGLLPSASHERVRNIVADPSPELDWLVSELDDRLQRDDALATLPGRWLFALSDEMGPSLDAPYDVAFQQFSPTSGRLLAGRQSRPCSPAEAVRALLDVANRFLAVRESEAVWNLRDLPANSPVFDGFDDDDDGGGDTTTAEHGRGSDPTGVSSVELTELGVPLGFLTPVLADALVATLGSSARIVVTPHRSLVLPADTSPEALDELIAAGFHCATDPRRRVTACIGAPFCRRTDSPTVEIARTTPAPEADGRLHIVGCERACGRPTSTHTLVVAPRSADDVADARGDR